MSRDLELAYLAGFMDGEGSISLVRRRSPASRIGIEYIVRIDVGNTRRNALDLFQLHFGGTVYLTRYPSRIHANHQDFYRWGLMSRKATEAVRQLLPYLEQKREHALQVIAAQKILTSRAKSGTRWLDNSVREQQMTELENIRQKLRALNKRGRQ